MNVRVAFIAMRPANRVTPRGLLRNNLKSKILNCPIDEAGIWVQISLELEHMGDDQGKTPDKTARRLRILVVEDHGETLQTMSRLLTHFGHEISMANSTQSALEIVDAQEFDVVLSDIGLPDGSGYDVISQAKKKWPVKGVALTGFDKEEDIERSKKAGFDFHLTKPVDFHELRTVLGQIGS